MKSKIIVHGVPSSFVASEKKYARETGAGEAKLYLGHLSKESDYDAFFEMNEHGISNCQIRFSKDNLIEYHTSVKLEYLYRIFGEYRDVNINKWKELYLVLDGLSDGELNIELEKYTDRARYYIRATEPGKYIFDLFRKIVFPKITDVTFEKENNTNDIIIRLTINGEQKIRGIGLNSNLPRNLIVFGAPGTGKSRTVDNYRLELLGDSGYYERVTFHPDYSYGSFVGTYKPVPIKGSNNEDSISYEYVPGPFMRTLVQAIKNLHDNNVEIKPHLLIIEEINRANPAAVFGDVFQLLDRNDGVSEYPIQASEDVKKYLVDKLGGDINTYNEIKIPNNMFIWATMNSADQGVFPMDTAFKRRWSFEYIGIDDAEKDLSDRLINVGQGNYSIDIEWNRLRKAINNYLSTERINEDKLLGPFFINVNSIKSDEHNEKYIDKDEFAEIFKSKVLMYLFEDAAKQRIASLFAGVSGPLRYSSICKEFDLKGVNIFNNIILSTLGIDVIP